MFHRHDGVSEFAIIAVGGKYAAETAAAFRIYSSSTSIKNTAIRHNVQWSKLYKSAVEHANIGSLNSSSIGIFGFPNLFKRKAHFAIRNSSTHFLTMLSQACAALENNSCDASILLHLHLQKPTVLVLKRLEDAIVNHDMIFGVVQPRTMIDTLPFLTNENEAEKEQNCCCFNTQSSFRSESIFQKTEAEFDPVYTSQIDAFLHGLWGVYYRLIPQQSMTCQQMMQLRGKKYKYAIAQEQQGWLSNRESRVSDIYFQNQQNWMNFSLVEAPLATAPDFSRNWQLLPLSADSKEELKLISNSFSTWLNAGDQHNLADVAYTLQRGRFARKYRSFAVCDEAETVQKPTVWQKNVRQNEKRKTGRLAFMFPGVGDGFLNCGAELYESEPYFGETIDIIAEYVVKLGQTDFRDILYPEVNHFETAINQINDPIVQQISTFAVNIALAELWRSWGIHPAVLIGHDVGEIVAAVIAGVFSIKDGIRLCIARGEILQKRGCVTQITARITEKSAVKYCSDQIFLSAVHAPKLVTFSGEPTEMSALAEFLKRGKIQFTINENAQLHQKPFSSNEKLYLTEVLQNIKLSTPTIPIVSTVYGNFLSDADAISDAFWLKQFSTPINFAKSIRTIGRQKTIYAEMGIHTRLSAYVSQTQPTQRDQVIPIMGNMLQSIDNHRAMLTALGKMWSLGIDVDWKSLYEHESRQYEQLPTVYDETLELI